MRVRVCERVFLVHSFCLTFRNFYVYLWTYIVTSWHGDYRPALLQARELSVTVTGDILVTDGSALRHYHISPARHVCIIVVSVMSLRYVRQYNHVAGQYCSDINIGSWSLGVDNKINKFTCFCFHVNYHTNNKCFN